MTPAAAMPRPFLRPSLLALVLATASAVPAVLPGDRVLAQGTVAPTAPAARGQSSSALVEARTEAAAERILMALRARDGARGFSLFTPSLQRMTSPALVQERINRMPKLVSWTLEAAVPGQDSSTITARLRTSAGPRNLEMVIDGAGRLEGYHFDTADQPAETVARQFVEAMAQGRYVSAASFLTIEMQAEIPPAALQVKWQRLQRHTGDFVAIRQVFRSESTPDQKLVIVKTGFRRLTDNLFVILDRTNRVVGVDFPIEPSLPGTSN
jgi:hypothetical protein